MNRRIPYRTYRQARPKGTASYIEYGPWALLLAVDAICPDGRVRRCRVGIPDTFFSGPARVQVRGRTVTGFVTLDEEAWTFKENASSKNASVFACH